MNTKYSNISGTFLIICYICIIGTVCEYTNIYTNAFIFMISMVFGNKEIGVLLF